MGGADTSLPNIDRYKMDLPSEIYPNDPMPRGISTPPMNMKFNLGEDIGRDVDRGVMNGFGAERQYQDPMIEIEQNLGNIRFESGNEVRLPNLPTTRSSLKNQKFVFRKSKQQLQNLMKTITVMKSVLSVKPRMHIWIE